MGLYLGLTAAAIAGMIMLEMAFTDPSMEIGARIMAVVLGIIMIAPGAMLAYNAFRDRKQHREDSHGETHGEAGSLIQDLKEKIFVIKKEITTDKTPEEKLITAFRRDYDGLFRTVGLRENMPIQEEATQVYWHFLML